LASTGCNGHENEVTDVVSSSLYIESILLAMPRKKDQTLPTALDLHQSQTVAVIMHGVVRVIGLDLGLHGLQTMPPNNGIQSAFVAVVHLSMVDKHINFLFPNVNHCIRGLEVVVLRDRHNGVLHVLDHLLDVGWVELEM
jgi:hypothetical protein